ncbi:MAG: site-2 protease family protein [Demequina sp.]
MTSEPKPTRGLLLGRILGARIVVQPSTALMLVVLALLFSSGPGLEVTRRTFAEGLVLALLLFVSVFLHELAHAVTARGMGREVREIVITLWGGHTSFDARGLTPLINGATAAAGPAANLLIAVALQGFLMAGVVDGRAQEVITWVIFANVLLAVFNALPGIPMDGGRVLEAIVWAASGSHQRGTVVAAWGGRVVAIVVVAFALLAPLASGGTPGVFEFVWAALIFGILWPAASSALAASRLMVRREGLTVAALTVPAVAVPHHVTVSAARERAGAANADEVVVMAPDGAPAGHFPVTLTDAVPAHERDTASLQSVTMPLPRGAHVGPQMHGDDLVDALKQWWGKTDVWVVMDGEHVIGVVKLADALKAAQ